MKLIDLSQPIYHDCPNCPVHPPVTVEIAASHANGDDWHMERLALVSHTGSHIDAPLHKIGGGASISELLLESFVGPAYIADGRACRPEQPLDARWLEEHLPDVVEDHIVLLATGWGEKRARSDEWLYRAPFLSPDGARWLVERRARAVGIDHYSIGGAQEPRNGETHEVLLGNGLWIVEELHFPRAIWELPQPVQFWALPMNWRDFSGAFCRPVVVVADSDA